MLVMLTRVTFFSRLTNLFSYSLEFYLRKLPVLLIFSVPMVFAFLIPLLVPAPTFLAFGSEALRTGSLPDLSWSDVIITVLAYLISLFIIADAIANINLIIKSKRTRTLLPSEIWAALSTYALRITYVYTILLLLIALIHLLTFEQPAQSVLYPLFVFILSYLFFFIAPAIIIDDASVTNAITYSIRMVLKKPLLFLAWVIFGFILLSLVRLGFGMVLPEYASALTLWFNALFILPFLIILQTQMYIEKYPLAY